MKKLIVYKIETIAVEYSKYKEEYKQEEIFHRQNTIRCRVVGAN